VPLVVNGIAISPTTLPRTPLNYLAR